jgi:hypothetical protein
MPVGNVENGIVSLDMDWRPSDMASPAGPRNGEEAN